MFSLIIVHWCRAKRLEESLANNQIPFELLEYYYEEGALYAANIGIQCNDLDAERRIVRPTSVRLATPFTDILHGRSWLS
jgi:hypothetical protein